jgi:hypothetical protein
MGQVGWRAATLLCAGASLAVAALGSPLPEVDAAPSAPETTVVAPAAAFPLQLSAEGHLVDANGQPFQIRGDSAWTMMAQLDIDEVDAYLDERAAQGFNSIIVSLVEPHFTADPPNTVSGLSPFTTPEDWTTPNAEYFDWAAEVIGHAADRGVLVLLAPAYLGWGGGDEGFYQVMMTQGPEPLREYGRFIGARFADLPNIVWLNGGDFTPPPEGVALVQAIVDGIRENDTTHLHTAHWAPESGASDLDVDFVDIDNTYTYGPVHALSLTHFERGGPPRFVIESAYEGDEHHNASNQRIRAQGYESLLTGAIGYVFGNHYIWQFLPEWREMLDSVGATGMKNLWALVEDIDLAELQPDVDHSVLIDGQGEIGGWSYALAAFNDTTILAYVPDQRAITLALEPAWASAQARWYDPTDGTFVPVSSWEPDEAGHVTVETPGQNAGGDGDWVLVVGTPGAPQPEN